MPSIRHDTHGSTLRPHAASVAADRLSSLSAAGPAARHGALFRVWNRQRDSVDELYGELPDMGRPVPDADRQSAEHAARDPPPGHGPPTFRLRDGPDVDGGGPWQEHQAPDAASPQQACRRISLGALSLAEELGGSNSRDGAPEWHPWLTPVRTGDPTGPDVAACAMLGGVTFQRCRVALRSKSSARAALGCSRVRRSRPRARRRTTEATSRENASRCVPELGKGHMRGAG